MDQEGRKLLTAPWMAYAGVVLLIIICVAVLFCLRDPLPGSARRVSHAVWCPRYKRVAEVLFREGEGRSGLVRTVEECPLRRRRERCGETCGLAPAPPDWMRRVERRLRACVVH
jgi:hypothetical protein